MGILRYPGTFLLTVCAAFAQAPTITAVVNGGAGGGAPANIASRLCPGVVALVNGTNLGASTSVAVTVAGKKAAVIAANNAQLRIEIPIDAPLGETTITVGSSAPFNITLSKFAPELVIQQGGFVLAFHQNQTQVSAASPALAGEAITVVATGLGPTSPVVPTGTPSSGSETTTAPVTAVVMGKPAKVLNAGLTPGQVGQYFVYLTLPAAGVATGTRPMTITVGTGNEATTSNVGTLNFQALPPIILINNYSGIFPGLPNYGIAQGSIFLAIGSGVANGSTGFQNPPLQTTVSGVSVDVTVNGSTVHPFIYYLTQGQLALVLPSNTPIGDGQITVNNNGATVGPAPIHVVASAPGLLTINGLGTGMGNMFDVNYRYIGYTNAVQPGEYVNLFGSGIGPSPDSDQNPIASQTNLVGKLAATVTVGGQQAQITYLGRSAYPGLDQIQFIVPNGVTPGCWVGLAARVGNTPSNFIRIPVTPVGGGRSCQDPTLGIGANTFQTVLSKSAFGIAAVTLSKETDVFLGANPSTSFTDEVKTDFIKFNASAFTPLELQNSSVGSCSVYTWSGQDNGPMGSDLGPSDASELDAGPALNIGGPNGKATANKGTGGGYRATIGGGTGSGTPLAAFIPQSGAGTFSIDNGSGGPDIGAFATNVTTGAAPVWSNQMAIATFNRLDPPAITWTGGSPGYYAIINGGAGTFGPIGTVGANFSCAVPSTDGQFVLPSDVAFALPATSGASGYLSVQFSNIPPSLTIPGTDFGFFQLLMNQSSLGVTFQ